MFDLSSYNTFNLAVSAREGLVVYEVADLENLPLPLEEPYIILGGGSDVLFTEDFVGTVLINRIMGVSITKLPRRADSAVAFASAAASSAASAAVAVTAEASVAAAANDAAATAADTAPPSLSSSIAVAEIYDSDSAFEYVVRVGGGVVLDDLIAQLLKEDICGLENLSLIPGTVGAAPIQNIGAYGVEIGDFIESIEAFDLRTGETKVFTAAQCHFGYRYSIFKEPEYRSLFITHVTLRLSKTFVPHQNYAGLQSMEFKDAFAMRERVIALRNEKLPNPKYVGNAGSFFKNPYVNADVVAALQAQFGSNVPCYPCEDGRFKLAAGWLIDKANCRGLKHGQVGTWGKQALVIVNLGNAKPHEVLALARYISAEVKSKFGIDLVPEVRLYGKHGEIAWDQI